MIRLTSETSNSQQSVAMRPAECGSDKASLTRSGRKRARLLAYLFALFTLLAGPAFALPDWALGIEDPGQDGLPAGSTLVYEVEIRNDAFGASNNAGPTTITFTVGAGTTMVDGGGLLNCVTLGVPDASVTCDVPPIDAGSAQTFLPQVETSGAGSPTFSGSIPSAGDANGGNNSASQQTTVTAGADIELTVTGPSTAPSGTVVDYVFTAENNGPNDSNGFDFVFPVPSGLQNITPPSGCILSGGNYECSIPGVIGVNETVDITFQGQLSAANGSAVTPSGAVTNGSPADGDGSNNIASIETTVTAGSDLSIGKSISDDELLVGETATFTLTSEYTGDDPQDVQIIDVVPVVYSVTSIDTAGTGWDCSASTGNVIDCTQANGSGSGANISLGDITIEVLVIEDTGGVNVANEATISSAGPVDPNPANNTADDGGVIAENPVVDHQANKSGPTEPVAVGSEYDFSISSTNVGNAAFYGTLQLEDTIPAGADYTSVIDNGWSCSPAAPQTGPVVITCQITYTESDPLLPGQTTPAVITGVTPTTTGPLLNTLQVSAPVANIEDLESPNDIIAYTVTGEGGAVSPDVSVIKTVDGPTTVPSGEVVTFTIEVLNNGPVLPASGPVNAEGVVVTDEVRDLINNIAGAGGGLESLSFDPQGTTGMTCDSAAAGSRGRSVTCNIAVLPECTAGVDCPTITIGVRPGGNAWTRTNTAKVISTITADSDPDNNTSSASYMMTNQTDVTVSKTATPNPASIGQDLLYVVTAENKPVDAEGRRIILSPARDVSITDTLPNDVTFVSASASGGGTCTTALAAGDTTDGSNNDVVCEWAIIGSGGQQTVSILVRPNNATLGNTPPDPSLTNDVEIETTTAETDTGNNSATVVVDIIEPAFDLLINKTDDVDPLPISGETTYTITATNGGPSAAENVVIVDQMPASGLGFSSFIDGDGVTCAVTDPGTAPANSGFGNLGVEVTCSVAYLAAGESASFQIVAKGDTKGSATNMATVSADNSEFYETNTGNDQIGQTTTVRSLVDVRVNSKTADRDPVNLGEDFSWTIQVENYQDDSVPYGNSDGTVLTDNLPSGMILTATPVVVAPGAGTCTGTEGSTSFTCTLGDAGGVPGTMDIGEVLEITVPVRVVTVTTDAQTFSNSASVEATGSFDADPDNNDSTGTVVVNSGTISGEIFRDFNDDGTKDPGDSNVQEVTLTLTGTDLNGNSVDRVITTTDGTYSFGLLPEGEYTITRGPITEAYQTDGQNTPGTTGGPLYTDLTSPTIVLGGNEDASNWDFAIVPQARIGLAKAVQGTPALNPDGTFDVPFRFVIQNFSLEAVDSVEVSDVLTGAAPSFGAYTTGTTAADMSRGSYMVLTPPAADCGTGTATFTGEGADIIALSGATIAAESSCVLTFEVRVNPTDPLPTGTPQYENSATVTGEGVLSGQTSATNPLLADTSDNGANPDADGDGSADDANEDDPTPVNVEFLSTVELEKTVDTSAFADPAAPVAGELLTYTYVVRNPNQFDIFDINVIETPPGAAGTPPAFTGTGTPPVIGAPAGGADIDGQGDLPDLAPGGAITYTATYAITQDDIDTGFVQNTATVTATDVYGDPISDFSDDTAVNNGTDYNGDDNPDDPTVATLPRVAKLSLEKTILSDTLSEPPAAGDTIEYQVVVTNTGNTNITDVAVTDPGPEFGGVAASNGPVVFTTTDATDLSPTDEATFTGTYTLDATDAANFLTAASPTDAILNEADATGNVPGGTTLETEPDTAETGVSLTPGIELTKAITQVTDTNGNGILGDAGDEVLYDLTVTNTGITSLANVRVTDAKLGLTNAALTAPSTGANLAPGDSGAIEDQSYTITPLDQAQGEVVNTAEVSGTPVATNTDGTPDAGTPLVDDTGAPLPDETDTSDTLTDPDLDGDGNVVATDDPAADGDDTATVLNLPTPEAGITITKRVDMVADTNMNGLIGDAEDTITYSLVVTNTGDTSLADVMVTDALLGVSQNVGNMAAGDEITLSGLTYMITVQDQADRVVENTAEAEGNPVATGPGNVPDPSQPLVDATGADLDNVTDDSDTLTDPDINADGSVDDVDDPAAGGADDPTLVKLPPTGPEITIVKSIAELRDLNGNGLFGDAGDEVIYNFTVTNTGNVSLAGVTVTDAMLGLADAPVTPANLAPTESATLNGTSHIITAQDQAGGQLENTATTSGQPVVTNPDGTPDPATPLQAPDGSDLDPVTDTSDTLTEPDLDTDGNPVSVSSPGSDGSDDPTLLNLPPVDPEITLEKEIVQVFDANGTGLFGDVGDTVQYLLTVTNTGNTSLAGITITDAKLGLTDVAVTPGDLPPGGVATLSPALYTITAQDQGAGEVENTAQASGDPVETGPGNLPLPGAPLVDADGNDLDDVTDTSDTLTEPDLDASNAVVSVADPDADGTDSPTLLTLPEIAPEITLVKSITDVTDVNGNGLFGDVGDQVTYELTVTNTGNTALAGVTVTDAKLGLTAVPVSPADLGIGDSATLTSATLSQLVYTITPLDQAARQVENTATTEGQPVATDPVTGNPDPSTPLLDASGSALDPVNDTSDTLTDPDLDADGNPVSTAAPDADGTDTPTLLNLPADGPEISLAKSIAEVRDINGNGLFGDVGDEIVYDLTVRNTGNTALAGVTITDAKLGVVDVAVTPANLLPGDSATLAGQVYTVTALDQGVGEVINTATTQGQPVATGSDGLPDPGTPLIDPATGAAYEPVTDDSNTLTDADLDADGNPVPVIGADPGGDGSDTPTELNLPPVMPELTLVKSIAEVRDINGNGLFGDVGDEVVYDLTLTNTGNTSLSGVTITDAKLGLTDVAVSPSALAPDDSAALTGQVYTITPLDQAAGEVENTATTEGQPVATLPGGTPDVATPLLDGTGAALDPVTDISDTLTDPDLDTDGTPISTADPDADGPDTPTVLNLPATEPEITLVKSIIEVRDINGNDLFGDVGDEVVYELTVTNTGNTALAGVTINDAKLELVDAPVAPADLAPDASATLTGLVYSITAQDQAAGEVINTATAAGLPVATLPDGTPDAATPLVNGSGAALDPVTDVSDTLTDPELDAAGAPVTTADPAANGPDTPTELVLPAVEPEITLVKSIAEVRDLNGNELLGDVGDEVVYDFTVTNTGNTALANVSITDALLGLTDVPVTPTALAPGDEATLTGQVYSITPADQAAGLVENTATAAGDPVATLPDGSPDLDTPLLDAGGTPLEPVTDLSDTLTDPDLDADGAPVSTADPDADGADNPTILNLPDVAPEITLVKAVTEVVDENEDLVLGNAGDVVVYLFTATNTGNTALAPVTLSDPLLALVDAPMDPNALAPGDTASLTAELLITDDIFDAGVVENTATVAGQPVATGTDGRPLPDTPLENPDGSALDPATDLSDTGSQPDAEEDGTIIAIGEPAGTGTGDDPTFLNLPLVASPLSISGTVFLDTNRDGVLDGSDDPTAGAGYTVNLLDEDGNIVDSVVTDADGNYEMTGFPAGTYTVQFVDPDGVVAGVSDAYTLDLANPTQTGVDFPLVRGADQSISTLTITKAVANRVVDVKIGDIVPYRIEVINSDPILAGPATVVDRLPQGLIYVPGSAQIDGVTATPEIGGQRLSFTDLFVPGSDRMVITLSARVGPAAPTGNLVNTATLFDGVTGEQIAPRAEATVRRVPEHVFDCSDVIGTVFHDINGNGYQDGPQRASGVTDQTFLGGKNKAAAGADPANLPGEPGLPGVRIATVNGTLITTDSHGRFHVPCAELPGAIGTNFILKLDERTLPSGYRLTTENPRVVRLTAGKFAKMNFGASLSRVIDITVNGGAFVSGLEPTPKLKDAVRNLARTLATQSSVVRLSYVASSPDEVRLGRARMRAVEKLLRQMWRQNGTYKLTIEKTITRRQ
ncbi:DUF7507 domain-containing protein [Aliishimia ponticola]|nr:SdrD B-like domain-containing protein [Aliishimia ponticola]